MLLCPENILKGFAMKLLCSCGNPQASLVFGGGGFLFVQLKFGTALTSGCLLLPEAIAEERWQSNVLTW